MKISASVISNPGIVREQNEDNFYFDGWLLEDNQTPKTYKLRSSMKYPVLLGVFDGMGGISAGAKASYLTADMVADLFEEESFEEDIPKNLIELCMKSNERLCDEMMQVEKKRMGSTASMLCFYNSRFYLCNIGDSPIFIYREGVLKRISVEHTERANFVLLHGEEAIPPKKKFKLTQHIGIFPEEMEIEPYVMDGVVQEGDRFIICSDGLTDMVEIEEIAEVLEKKEPAWKTVSELLDRALDNGGKDNITIICADVKKSIFERCKVEV